LSSSEWLGKKIGAGVAKLETFSDMQFERESRFSYLKMKELITEFCTAYLRLIQNRLLKHPLGPPSVAQRLLLESGTSGYIFYCHISDTIKKIV
jgi:hypothetical protein